MLPATSIEESSIRETTAAVPLNHRFVLLVGLIGLAFTPLVVSSCLDLWKVGVYLHAPLVIGLVAVLCWQRWPESRQPWDTKGYVYLHITIALSLVLFGVALALSISWLSSLSLAVAVFAVIASWTGPHSFGSLAPVGTILVLLTPSVIALQVKVVQTAGRLLDGWLTPHLTHSTSIELPIGNLDFSPQACGLIWLAPGMAFALILNSFFRVPPLASGLSTILAAVWVWMAASWRLASAAHSAAEANDLSAASDPQFAGLQIALFLPLVFGTVIWVRWIMGPISYPSSLHGILWNRVVLAGVANVDAAEYYREETPDGEVDVHPYSHPLSLRLIELLAPRRISWLAIVLAGVLCLAQVYLWYTGHELPLTHSSWDSLR